MAPNRFRLILTAVLLLAMPPAAPARGADDSDAEETSRRKLQAEIDALTAATPVAREAEQIQEQLHELYDREEKARRPLSKRLEALQQTPAYEKFLEKHDALEEELDTAWETERRAMAAAAQKLYAARHDELRRLTGPPLKHSPGFGVLNYPRLDGSTSAHPLSVIVASRLFEIPYKWIYPEPTGYPWQRQVGPYFLGNGHGQRDDGSNYEFSLAVSRIVAYGQAPAQERVAAIINSLLAISTTTHDALVNLGAGKCDLVLTVRRPTPGESKAAADHGQRIVLMPVAHDALVFIVNHRNPVKSLSLDQVRSIYSMKTKRWQEFGGKNAEILPLMREPKSGSRELFDELVMKGVPQLPLGNKFSRNLLSSSMIGPYNRVTEEEFAMGYSVWYYERFMALSPRTRTIAIDGVEPTAKTIASGRYPLVVPLYAAYRESDRSDSPGRQLLTWLQSAEGQAVVRESGYVTLK